MRIEGSNNTIGEAWLSCIEAAHILKVPVERWTPQKMQRMLSPENIITAGHFAGLCKQPGAAGTLAVRVHLAAPAAPAAEEYSDFLVKVFTPVMEQFAALPDSTIIMRPVESWMVMVDVHAPAEIGQHSSDAHDPSLHQAWPASHQRPLVYMLQGFPYTPRTLEDLAEELREQDRVTGRSLFHPDRLQRVLDAVLPVALALHALHRARLVHRALGMTSVLLYPGGRVLLAGCEHAIPSAFPLPWNSPLPLLMAPELLAEPSMAAHPSQDAWSFAILLWHLVLGSTTHPVIPPQALQELAATEEVDNVCSVAAALDLVCSWPSELAAGCADRPAQPRPRARPSSGTSSGTAGADAPSDGGPPLWKTWHAPPALVNVLRGLACPRAAKRWSMGSALRSGLWAEAHVQALADAVRSHARTHRAPAADDEEFAAALDAGKLLICELHTCARPPSRSPLSCASSPRTSPRPSSSVTPSSSCSGYTSSEEGQAVYQELDQAAAADAGVDDGGEEGMACDEESATELASAPVTMVGMQIWCRPRTGWQHPLRLYTCYSELARWVLLRRTNTLAVTPPAPAAPGAGACHQAACGEAPPVRPSSPGPGAQLAAPWSDEESGCAVEDLSCQVDDVEEEGCTGAVKPHPSPCWNFEKRARHDYHVQDGKLAPVQPTPPSPFAPSPPAITAPVAEWLSSGAAAEHGGPAAQPETPRHCQALLQAAVFQLLEEEGAGEQQGMAAGRASRRQSRDELDWLDGEVAVQAVPDWSWEGPGLHHLPVCTGTGAEWGKVTAGDGGGMACKLTLGRDSSYETHAVVTTPTGACGRNAAAAAGVKADNKVWAIMLGGVKEGGEEEEGSEADTTPVCVLVTCSGSLTRVSSGSDGSACSL